MHHVWHCRTAVARLRIHNTVQYALARELRTTKGNVDMERAMPDMAVRKPDGSLEPAIMDLTVWYPGTTAWHGVDVTVRYPGATRYYGAADLAGKAASKAEAEKVKRYGKEVLPLAYETGGRLGVQSRDTLRKLAALAAATDGGILTAAGLENRWRRRIESALMFAVADTLLLALGGDQAAEIAASKPATTGAWESSTASLPTTTAASHHHPAQPAAVAPQPTLALCTGMQQAQHEEPFDIERELEACCDHFSHDEASGHPMPAASADLAADEAAAAEMFSDSELTSEQPRS